MRQEEYTFIENGETIFSIRLDINDDMQEVTIYNNIQPVLKNQEYMDFIIFEICEVLKLHDCLGYTVSTFGETGYDILESLTIKYMKDDKRVQKLGIGSALYKSNLANYAVNLSLARLGYIVSKPKTNLELQELIRSCSDRLYKDLTLTSKQQSEYNIGKDILGELSRFSLELYTKHICEDSKDNMRFFMLGLNSELSYSIETKSVICTEIENHLSGFSDVLINFLFSLQLSTRNSFDGDEIFPIVTSEILANTLVKFPGFEKASDVRFRYIMARVLGELKCISGDDLATISNYYEDLTDLNYNSKFSNILFNSSVNTVEEVMERANITQAMVAGTNSNIVNIGKFIYDLYFKGTVANETINAINTVSTGKLDLF